jgi:hypothetical protein
MRIYHTTTESVRLLNRFARLGKVGFIPHQRKGNYDEVWSIAPRNAV